MRLDKKMIRALVVLLRYVDYGEMATRGEVRTEAQLRFVRNTAARIEQLLIDNSHDGRENFTPDILELCEAITERMDRKKNGRKEKRGGRRPYGTTSDQGGDQGGRLIDVWTV